MKVDEDALVTLVSLLRVSSQQAKGHLQKLFINLCEDRATMESTLRILLSLLRAPLSADEAQLSRPRPDQPAAPASLSAALQVLAGHLFCTAYTLLLVCEKALPLGMSRKISPHLVFLFCSSLIKPC